MTNLDSNTLLLIVIGIIIIIAVIYYFNRNNRPIPNHGTINKENSPLSINKNSVPVQRVNAPLGISDSIVNDLVADYNKDFNNSKINGIDPLSSDHGIFNGYGKKKQIQLKETDLPYEDSDEYDERDFSYKKQKFTKRTPEDVKDLFDVNKMLPQEIEEDWFDTEPLLTTKKIKGTHLIHPKVHMGVNTISSSLRNGTHDIRGDIANPKIPVSAWGNSTIEPDTNLKGICNPI